MSDVRSSNISVEKIGGTFMTEFGDVLRLFVLHDPVRINGRIDGVSAYSGVTHQLLEHKKGAKPVSGISTWRAKEQARGVK